MKQQDFGWTVHDDSKPPEDVALITVERTGKQINAVSLFEPKAPLNQRRWRIILSEDGSLTLQLWNDKQAICQAMRVERVGIKPIPII